MRNGVAFFSYPVCNGAVYLGPADEHFPIHFWTCERCDVWGETRDGARSFFPLSIPIAKEFS
jgi:hypothetical protein